VGEGEHVAFFWPSSEGIVAGDDSDSEDEVDPRNYGLTRIGAQLDTLHITSSSSSLSSLSRSSSTTSLSTTASASTHYGESSISGLASLVPVSTQSDFASECTLSLDRSFAEDHTVDNAAIELKTLRMASNVPLGQVRDVVISFILARCETTASVPAIIKRWGGLVGSLTGNQEEAMADSILTVQRVVAESGKETNFFLRVLKGFYEQDVVSEEAVFGWYKSAAARMTGGEAGRELWSGSKPFVQFLMESSSDEEESD
jgi:translation initiation factor eIF-2B subunit epsilon